jgi:hypothetical protein
MKILWIAGWAVSPDWLAAQARACWPEAEHAAVTPTSAAAALAKNDYDALGGYSLGALWLLSQAKEISEKTPVVLLAPIFAFSAEQRCGGRVALAQLRLQRRRLRQDAPAAVADFFRRAGLADSIPLPDKFTAKEIAALDEELGWLETLRAPSPPQSNWQGVAGAEDPLTEAAALKKLWPALRVVTGAGHAPGPLLRAALKLFLQSFA